MQVSRIECIVRTNHVSATLNDSFWQLDSMNLPAGTITLDGVQNMAVVPTYQTVNNLSSGVVRYHTTSISTIGTLRFTWTATVPQDITTFEMVSNANTTLPKIVEITAFDDATNTAYPQPLVLWGNQNCASTEYATVATRSALNATSHETKTIVLQDTFDVLDDDLRSWNYQQPLGTACVPVLGVDNQPTYGWVTLVQMFDAFNTEDIPEIFTRRATPSEPAKFTNLVAGLYSVTATPDKGISGSPTTATLLVSERY